jgi:CheY-like chemotaxis protein
MKADERLRDIPIIVITVLDRRYTAQQGLDLQRVNGFIRKPFMPQELVETVNSALRPVA